MYVLLTIIAKKAVPKATNSRALTSEKPCINKESHVPLMHRSLTFHMQDSGQYTLQKLRKFAVMQIRIL